MSIRQRKVRRVHQSTVVFLLFSRIKFNMIINNIRALFYSLYISSNTLPSLLGQQYKIWVLYSNDLVG